MFPEFPPSCKNILIRGLCNITKVERPTTIINSPIINFILKTSRTPLSFFCPKYWAEKIPAPDIPPNTARLKTKISWLTTATPVIWSVPTLPTITLSNNATILVKRLCITIGRAMARIIL